ncbi:FUSC family protein [Cellulosimicrobium cellulans]|uniref:FUSC family protein n=1 Tax=Cellulosimicrobium cellulans TaxID=1710 RepID=UPI002096AC67|nr:FUSC family protein [Cellulosimicrobium cellulans]MCO7274560.1 FUSC family protein [Cellulosimicrobium cellulans]
MTAGPASGRPPGPDSGPGAVDVARTAWRRLLLRARIRQGVSRVRVALWPILQASAAAGLAFGIARYGLGHTAPFFAPVSAWVCLGFSQDRQLRRVLELAVGVAIGVGLGDLVVHAIGSGWWQVAVVLAVSALAARFIDRGAMLTTQAGVQAIVIVGLPAAQAGGPLGRWTDALVGGAVALAVAALTPGDPRRRPRLLGAEATTELAAVLDVLARGLRRRDRADLEAALVKGRASEGALEDWQSAASSARELARVTAAGLRHRDELGGLERQAVLVDRAMRSVRVLARRAMPVAGGPDERELDAVADLVARFGAGVHVLAEAVGAGRDPAVAREVLLEVAHSADPHALGDGDWQVQSLVMLVRSPIVDLLEAAGASPQQARDALPEL